MSTTMAFTGGYTWTDCCKSRRVIRWNNQYKNQCNLQDQCGVAWNVERPLERKVRYSHRFVQTAEVSISKEYKGYQYKEVEVITKWQRRIRNKWWKELQNLERKVWSLDPHLKKPGLSRATYSLLFLETTDMIIDINRVLLKTYFNTNLYKLLWYSLY